MHANEWVFEIIDCQWSKRAYEVAIDYVRDIGNRKKRKNMLRKINEEANEFDSVRTVEE